MARRRKKSTRRKQSNRFGFRHALIGLAVLTGVGVLAFAQNGLDEIASIINRDTTRGAKAGPARTDPVRTAAVPSLPRSMAAPAARPDTRTRAPGGEAQKPKIELTGAARTARPEAVARTTPRAKAAAGPAPVRPPVGLSQAPARTPVRPASMPAVTPATQPASLPANLPAGLRPLRKPQEGNCLCPYDLMINGAQCGERSTYMTPGRERPVCYR